MDVKKKLDHNAYGGCKGEEYLPFIATSQAMPETTIVSILMGVIFACFFAAANTYLGLKVGLTISAGIPGAIMATGLLKIIFRRNNILEANMVSSISAMGESIAGGIIFTLPAIIMWGLDLKLSTIVVITVLGGALGVFFVSPLRRYLIIEEHGKLDYPESMAAAEVLVTGSTGGQGFVTVMTGLLVGGFYKLVSGGFALFSDSPEWTVKPFANTIFGISNVASLAGVGFIVGIRTALYMFGGSLIAWFGLMPLIMYVGQGLSEPLFPSLELISNMDAWSIWSKYIRYIGAGAVATGGFISLIKSAPTIVKSFKSAISGLNSSKGESVSEERINKDVPLTWIIAVALFVFLLSWLLPIIKVGFVGSLMIIVFSFFFSVVSARMVGVIGASNNPVSGMTIATILFATSILRALGYVGDSGMVVAILVGGITCVAIAVAGGAAQSLKTTFIIGGTPKNVQIGMYIGLAVASAVAGSVLLMLHNVYGIGSAEVPAPQAGLMSMVVKGVMTGELPWLLVLVGVAIALFCEMSKLPVLTIALGLYLPIHLSAAMLFGGVARYFVERKFNNNDGAKKNQTEKGILIASGLVAGDALMGIIVAIFATLQINIAFGKNIFPAFTQNAYISTALLAGLAIWMYRLSIKKDKL